MSRAISSLKLRQIADLTFQMVLNAKIEKAPVNVELIAQYCGVALEETDLGDDISGLLVVNGEHAVIAYSSNQQKPRRRFTIAHELGHFALHRNANTDTFFVDKDFIVKYRSNKQYSEVELRQEQEANAFAASLLMPKEFIIDELNKDNFKNMAETELIIELANVFKVSIAAMTFRLTNLNLLF